MSAIKPRAERISAHLANRQSVVRLREGRTARHLDIPVDQVVAVATNLVDLLEEARNAPQ